MKFSCPAKKCNYDGSGSYVLNISLEACMDEHNIATPFCPHCGQTLTKVESELEQ